MAGPLPAGRPSPNFQRGGLPGLYFPGGGPYTRLTPSVVTTPSCMDATVQSGKTYHYVVTAVDSSAVESVYSAQVSAVIP
ncbi:MAG TPA: hypothetical protein VIG89_01825 [Candidatus Acidoferrales bacterium]